MAAPTKWSVARAVVFLAFAGLIGALFARPEDGLLLLSGIGIPLLPVTFMVAPGLWRNICPLLPLEHAYGRSPLATVCNDHCRPCLGCTENCFDRKPYTADLADAEMSWRAPRIVFAALLPGFVVGFFTLATHAELPLALRYLELGLCVLVSAGWFGVLSVLTGISRAALTAVYTAFALNLFYWFGGRVFAGALGRITGADVGWTRWVISAAVLAVTVRWARKTRASMAWLS
ncbi:hypothetical protein GPX89_24165 [Nocardia sp. ET3-3]|uniref:Uncharacterized protein n=1 Tax=Nocardia terrae TaxID=2675851 RepID=A0A7K1V1C8_9NOCA|nr:hypothetical protein [Nocardia terrae]MVU80331.1 hypothetical protein [Nocardia terrae]